MDSSYPLQLDLSLNIDKQNNYKLNYAVVNLGVSSLGGLQYIEMYKKYSEISSITKYIDNTIYVII